MLRKKAAHMVFADAPLFQNMRRFQACSRWGTDALGPHPSAGDVFVVNSEVVRVVSFSKATLDDATRADVKQVLFDAFLRERRDGAAVACFWFELVGEFALWSFLAPWDTCAVGDFRYVAKEPGFRDTDVLAVFSDPD